MIDLATLTEKNWETACLRSRKSSKVAPLWVHGSVEAYGHQAVPATPFQQQSFTGAQLEAYRAQHRCFD